MTTFKLGDKVRVTGSDVGYASDELQAGATGIITAAGGSTVDGVAWYSVRIDNARKPVAHGDVGWTYYDSELTKVED